MIAEPPQGILNSGNNFGRRCFQLKNAPSVLDGSALSEQLALTRVAVPKGLSEPVTPGRLERAFRCGFLQVVPVLDDQAVFEAKDVEADSWPEEVVLGVSEDVVAIFKDTDGVD